MIGIVILGHADYPSGLKSAIELLVGNPENFEALGLCQGESPDDYKSKISLLIDQVDDGDGVLVLVDLFGGTPSNTIAQIVSLNKNIQAITGANLPMAIHAIFSRDEMTNKELAAEVKDIGGSSVVNIGEIYQQVISENDDDF